MQDAYVGNKSNVYYFNLLQTRLPERMQYSLR